MNPYYKSFLNFLDKSPNKIIVSQRGKGKPFSIKRKIINNIDGIEVERVLGSYSFLELGIFKDIIELLCTSENKYIIRGDAMKYKFGYGDLSTDSIEGFVAEKYFNAKKGKTVFRRVSAITNILVQSGISEHGIGTLKLKI